VIGDVHCIDVAQDRDRWRAVVSAVMHLRFPQNTGNVLTGRGPVIFSRRTLLHGVSVVKLTFCSAVAMCFVTVCDAVYCNYNPFAVFATPFVSNR